MGSVTLLCGPPGCGKTEWIKRRYAEFVRGAGLDAALLLLPNDEAVRSVTRGLLGSGAFDGLVDARILSFPHFAGQVLRANHRLAPEIRAPQQRQIVRAILRAMVEDNRLDVLGTQADTPGLNTVLVEFFDDLKWAAIRPDDLIGRVAEAATARPIDVETAAVYFEYQAVLQKRQLYDAAGRFWEARDLLRDGFSAPFGQVRLVLVDGFADFPTTQLQVLAHLADIADETIITLPHAPGLTAADLAWLPERTLARILELIPDARCQRVPNAICPDDGLAHVRRHLFASVPPPPTAAGAEQVDVFVADTERDELEIIAEQIKLLLLEGTPAEQIAIAMPRPETRADLVESVFGAAGVPYALAVGEAAAVQPLVRLTACLLRLVTGEFHRDDVVALVRNPLIDLRALGCSCVDVADDVYLVACAAGIVSGREQWSQGLALHERRIAARKEISHAARSEDIADDPEVRMSTIDAIEREHDVVQSVVALYAKLCKLVDRFPTSASPEEHVAALRDALDALGVTAASLTQRVGPESMRRQNLESFDAFCEQLRLYREVCKVTAPGGTVSRVEFAADVAALTAQTSTRPGRARPGHVLITGLGDDLRQRRVEYLFVAGMTQSAYPPQHHESVLYPETDRVGVGGGGTFDLRTRADREASEAFIFHEAISAATRRLSLSYSDQAGHDELVLPSAYLQEVARLIDQCGVLPRRRKSPSQRDLPEAIGIRRLREGVLNRLFATAPESIDQQLVSGYRVVCDLDGETLRRAAAGAFAEHARYTRDPFDRYDGVLDAPDVVAAVGAEWGVEHTFSASQLSAYAKCPFRFFAERVLRLQAVSPPDEEPDRLELGRLAHESLAVFVRDWTQEMGPGAPVTSDTLDQALTMLHRAAEDVFSRHEHSRLVVVPALWEAVTGRLLMDLLAWPPEEAKINSKHDPGFFGPLLAEQRYGYGGVPALLLGAGDEMVQIGGYIDLIELVREPEGSLSGYAVYDFKTSAGAPSNSDIAEGRELQLPLYIMAAERLLAAEYGALECVFASYYRLHGGQAKRSSQITPDGNGRDELLAATERFVLAYARAIRDGRFPVAPTGKTTCEHCDIRGACRYADWRAEMKMGEKVGADGN